MIVRHTLIYLIVEEIFYSTATVFMKLSLLTLYRRIFKVASIKWPIWILATAVISWLQVQRNQKLVVSAMFRLGRFVVGVSVALLVVCYRLDIKSADVRWKISPIVIWAGTERDIGVVSACLPCLLQSHCQRIGNA